MLGAAQVVQQRAFLEIRDIRRRIPAKHVLGELQHIIDIAGFGRIIAQPLVQLVRRTEMFMVAMAAGDITMMIDHAVPEKAGGRPILRVARQFVKSGQAHELGNLGVGVFAGQDLLAAGQRVENRMVLEPASEFQIAFIAGISVQVPEGFVEPTVFASEDLLHLHLG